MGPETLPTSCSAVQCEAGLGALIPPELFPVIIENVQNDEDLRNCRLVSRAWCKFAQSSLFSQLDLSHESQCVAWNEKFDAHPHLASLVTHLKFFGCGIRSCDPEDSDYDGESTVIDRFLERDAALQLTARLPNVSSIIVNEFTGWGSLETDVILQCTGLRSLSFIWMSMKPKYLLEIVHSMPQLQSLTLSTFSVEHRYKYDRELKKTCKLGTVLPASERAFRRTVPHRLQSLTLDRCNTLDEGDMLMWLLGPRFDLTGVTKAKITWSALLDVSDASEGVNGHDFTVQNQLVAAIAPCVRDLELGIHSRSTSYGELENDLYLQHFVQTESLLQFPSVHTLTLRDNTRSYLGPMTITGLSIWTLIPTLVAPSLQKVTLRVELDLSSGKEGFSRLSEMPEWDLIDTRFSGPAYPSLKCITIRFKSGCFMCAYLEDASFVAPADEDLIADMMKCLPKLAGGKSLRFEPEPW